VLHTKLIFRKYHWIPLNLFQSDCICFILMCTCMEWKVSIFIRQLISCLNSSLFIRKKIYFCGLKGYKSIFSWVFFFFQRGWNITTNRSKSPKLGPIWFTLSHIFKENLFSKLIMFNNTIDRNLWINDEKFQCYSSVFVFSFWTSQTNV